MNETSSASPPLSLAGAMAQGQHKRFVALPLAGQAAFARVTPLLRGALLLGVGGGFLLATILTISAALRVNTGVWWEALAQAHGYLQLYGWAGLFVLGVALHFLPRLRGTPLVMPHLLPWIAGSLIASCLLRGFCQPLIAVSDAGVWRMGLIASGVLECVAIGLGLTSGVLTFTHGPSLAQRPALVKVLPFIAIAFGSLGLAAVLNGANLLAVSHVSFGLVTEPGDTLNVTLGIFGFLIPIALAMSVVALPMYAGLQAISARFVSSVAGIYLVGLFVYLMGIFSGATPTLFSTLCTGLGWLGIGGAMLTCVSVFLRMIRTRGSMPVHLMRLSPTPERMHYAYHAQIAAHRAVYGPFVPIIVSAYLWATLAAVLLLINGVALLTTGIDVVAIDAVRHSLTIGFITLLLCGIAPRMLTAFAGKNIASPKLVTATLWLGNSAAALRVGAVLLPLSTSGATLLQQVAFGLSGPLGLAVALCLAINLWPVLAVSTTKTQAGIPPGLTHETQRSN
ncbi:MAG: hypothetical protein H0X24_03305 [Ktedonobacterales bacterium]|nr:hypothetical protein [Ktedonobacterales bacterium]